MKTHYLIPIALLFSLTVFFPSAAVPQTNRELTDLAYEDFNAADKKMNTAYQQLLGILDEHGKSTLKEAQRKWLAWRDAQADFDAHHLQGGKLQRMEWNGSLARTTETRTAQLLRDYKRFKD
jgi:uncharacterized protein YecT (DUF1311 family)